MKIPTTIKHKNKKYSNLSPTAPQAFARHSTYRKTKVFGGSPPSQRVFDAEIKRSVHKNREHQLRNKTIPELCIIGIPRENC